MADWLPREYKEFNWNWVMYAGIIMVLAVGIPLVMVDEIGWGAVATAVGGACVYISGMVPSDSTRQ